MCQPTDSPSLLPTITPGVEAFDTQRFQDFVASHGFGDATDEGVAMGRRLLSEGGTYATAAAEVSYRGLTHDQAGNG